MDDRERLKRAVFENMAFDAARYLLSNVKGRENGAEKAQRHLNMSKLFVRVWKGEKADLWEYHLVMKVHDETASRLTNKLNSAIGFDMQYVDDDVVVRFMEKFWDIATDVLENEPAPTPGM